VNSETHLKTWNAYQRAWGPVHEAEREELLRSSVGDNILYTDPSSQTHGLQELMVRIAQSQQKFTGAYFRNDSFLEHHDQGLFLWTMYDKDGRAFVKGVASAALAPMADLFRQRASSKHRRIRLERTACLALDGCRQAEHAGQQRPSGRLRRSGDCREAHYEIAEHCRMGVSIAWQAATS
jgi:hypothetical protein